MILCYHGRNKFIALNCFGLAMMLSVATQIHHKDIDKIQLGIVSVNLIRIKLKVSKS